MGRGDADEMGAGLPNFAATQTSLPLLETYEADAILRFHSNVVTDKCNLGVQTTEQCGFPAELQLKKAYVPGSSIHACRIRGDCGIVPERATEKNPKRDLS